MNILESALKELLHRAYDESLIPACAAKGLKFQFFLCVTHAADVET